MNFKLDFVSGAMVGFVVLFLLGATFSRDIQRSWSNVMGEVEMFNVTVGSANANAFVVSANTNTLALAMNRKDVCTVIIKNTSIRYDLEIGTYNFTYGNGYKIKTSTHPLEGVLVLNTNQKLYGRIENGAESSTTVKIIQGGL